MATYNLRCIASLKPTIRSLPETKSLHDWENLSSSQPRRGLLVCLGTCLQTKGETIEWFNDLPSLEPGKCIQWPIPFDWTGRIPLKLEIFLISKNEKRFKCRRICPWQGAASFPQSLARPPSLKKTHFQIQYVYIYIHLHMYIWKTLLSSWKQNAHTYTFLVAGPLNPNIQPLKAVQPIETTCHYAVIILT